MTTTNAVPLENLAQRIARQQAELETLRRDYEARLARLADLKCRKEALEAQLRKLDSEIEAVNQGKTPPLQTAPTKTSPAKFPNAAPPAKAVRPMTLSARLVGLVREAKRPVTVKQLTDEVVRRKFPTSSKNILGLVQTRVRELVVHGILQHAQRQPGYVLAKSDSPAKASAPGKPVAGKAGNMDGAASSKKGPPKKNSGWPEKPLRVVLTELLAKSQRPLPARELARQAKAQGYRTKSKMFVDVSRVLLSRMDNVENVPGQGYRLKKGKAGGS